MSRKRYASLSRIFSVGIALLLISFFMPVVSNGEAPTETLPPSMDQSADTPSLSNTLVTDGGSIITLGKGMITDLKGDVKIIRPGVTGEIQAQKGEEIYTSDTVWTGENALATMFFNGVGEIKLQQNTTWTLRQFGQEDGNVFFLSDLALGKLKAKVKKMTGDSQYEIKTPTSVAAVRGTVFDLYVFVIDEHFVTDLAVSNGLVAFANLAGELTQMVAEDQRSQGSEDGSITAPVTDPTIKEQSMREFEEEGEDEEGTADATQRERDQDRKKMMGPGGNDGSDSTDEENEGEDADNPAGMPGRLNPMNKAGMRDSNMMPRPSSMPGRSAKDGEEGNEGEMGRGTADLSSSSAARRMTLAPPVGQGFNKDAPLPGREAGMPSPLPNMEGMDEAMADQMLDSYMAAQMRIRENGSVPPHGPGLFNPEDFGKVEHSAVDRRTYGDHDTASERNRFPDAWAEVREVYTPADFETFRQTFMEHQKDQPQTYVPTPTDFQNFIQEHNIPINVQEIPTFVNQSEVTLDHQYAPAPSGTAIRYDSPTAVVLPPMDMAAPPVPVPTMEFVPPPPPTMEIALPPPPTIDITPPPPPPTEYAPPPPPEKRE